MNSYFVAFAFENPILSWSLIGLLFGSFYYSVWKQRMKHQQRCGLHHVSSRRPE